MDGEDWVTGQFQANRGRLEAIAVRMLGSRAEAEDAVQEAWLRVARTDMDGVENFAGWLTTVTGRICLDRLKSRRAGLEELTGADLPEVEDPVLEHDPAQAAIVADSVGAALMVVLDAMAPEERVAFVLHDVFAVPFDTIGEILDRSTEAARQLASRARRRVQGGGPVAPVDVAQQRSLVEAFLRAQRQGDLGALVRLLHPDVVLQPDAAALQMGSRPVTRGAAEVVAAIGGGARGTRLVLVDGIPALAWAPGGRVRSIIEFAVADGLITAITVTADAERIAQLDVVVVAD